MILDARNSSRRCTSVTSLPKRVRKFASSMAESPPPITMILLPGRRSRRRWRRLTPWPISFCSVPAPASAPKRRRRRSAVRVSIHSPSTLRRNGRCEKSVSMTAPCMYSAPKCCACCFMFSTRSGPLMPSGKAGEILDQGGQGKLPAGLVAGDHQRLQIGARGVNGGGISGAAGADDDDVSHRI